MRMTIWQIILAVAGWGALGGLANCLISGEVGLPRMDSETKVWRPGWIGNVLVGAIAAVVVWGIYGPLAAYDLAASGKPQAVQLTIAQMLGSTVVGLSGGQILTLLAQKRADEIAKDTLAKTIKRSMGRKTKEPSS